jgi:hypothetical protein
MSIPRPVDGYKGQMTTPPDAWPETDEDALQNHANDLASTQTQLQKPLDKWRLTRTQIFDGSTWFGRGSKGASAEVDARIKAMQSIDDDLSKAITFFHNASTSVLKAKQHIIAICDQAQQEIDGLDDQDFKDDSDRQSAIREIVDAAHDLNTATVASAAEAIAALKDYKPPPLPDRIGASPSEEPLGVRSPGSGAEGPGAGSTQGPGLPSTQSSPDGNSVQLVSQTTAPPGSSLPAAQASPDGNAAKVVGGGINQPGSATPPGVVAPPGTSGTPGTPAAPGAAGTPATPANPPPVPATPARDAGGASDGGARAPAQSGPQYFANNPAPAAPKPPPAASGPGDTVGPSPGTTGGGTTPPTMSSPSPSGGDGAGPGTPSSSSGGGGGNGDTSQPSQMGEHSQDGDGKATAGAGQTPAGQAPLTPAQQQQAMLNDISKGIDQGSQAVQANPMVSPANAAQLPVNPQVPVDAPAAPPATAGPGASSGGGIPSGGGFSGGGSSAAPIGGMSGPAPTPMPLGPPATPTPAAPVGSGSGSSGTVSGTPGSTPTGPGVHAASTANTSAAGIAAPAPIPVSAARMERDAVAASAAAGAARRQKNGGNDALTLARRIGAALNVGAMDFGFFWVTGLCADGTIVVANSYGLGYIPDSVNLPAQVQLVTADESIPPSERAKWATYPILAIQGWAQAHSQKLRAIIATEAQFATFDPGTAKVVLQPDDIPDTGKMDGRSRLEVIAPAAASRLGSVSDAGLMELLPPAPADPQPPADDSAMLWFDLCKPLMSTMPDRGVAHLEAFVTYAEHAQELALYRAYTAVDGASQRAAIADWVYWQHLGVLMSDALSADMAV